MSRSWDRYRDLCQKGAEENYLFDRYVFRKLSLPLSVLLIRAGANPNAVTAISLVAALASLVFLTVDSRLGMLLAAAAVFTYYLLDHVDGELARYYVRTGARQPSLSGQYFDVLCHWYSHNLMLFFMGVGVWRAFGYNWVVLLGFVACIGTSYFPMLVAARVMAQRVGRDSSVVLRSEVQEVLGALERKQQEAATVRASWRSPAKWTKAAKELLGFPGVLILIIVVLLLDAFLPVFYVGEIRLNHRLLFLTFMAGFGVSHILYSARKWFVALRIEP